MEKKKKDCVDVDIFLRNICKKLGGVYLKGLPDFAQKIHIPVPSNRYTNGVMEPQILSTKFIVGRKRIYF